MNRKERRRQTRDARLDVLGDVIMPDAPNRAQKRRGAKMARREAYHEWQQRRQPRRSNSEAM